MKANSYKAIGTVMAYINLQMAILMRAIGRMTRGMVKVSSHGGPRVYTKESGRRI